MTAARELSVSQIGLQRAEVQVQTAELLRQATILEAEGQSEARRLVLEADGALEQKLVALVDINKVWHKPIHNSVLLLTLLLEEVQMKALVHPHRPSWI